MFGLVANEWWLSTSTRASEANEVNPSWLGWRDKQILLQGSKRKDGAAVPLPVCSFAGSSNWQLAVFRYTY